MQHNATSKIINLLRQYHRVHQDKLCTEHDPHCFTHQREKINLLVKQGQPITFILPAFPAKSPNHEKTASRLPDLGERLALRLLHQLCQRIQRLYWPGASILICSDGHVFSDLVMVPDQHVDDYANALTHIIRTEGLHHLSTFALRDYYGDSENEVMRQRLMASHAESLVKLKTRIKQNDDMTALFNGIHRFIYEDRVVQSPEQSKNQIRELAKEISYRVIQRSNAWGQLIAQAFPEAVRLSIHPQDCDSKKLGIMLLPCEDNWATPWHRVVLQNGDKYLLIKNKDALQMRANPVMVEGIFSHYVM